VNPNPHERTQNERLAIEWLVERVCNARVFCRPENQALTWIAKAQTMRNGVCNKAIKGGAGCYSERNLQYGIHGRCRKGKTEFPGLLARKVVYVAGGYPKGGLNPDGTGLTPSYAIDFDVLRTFLPSGVDATPKGEPSTNEKGEPKDAQKGEPSAPNETEKGAHVQTSISSLHHNVASSSPHNFPSKSHFTPDDSDGSPTANEQPRTVLHPVPLTQAPAGNLPSIQPISKDGRQEGVPTFAGEEQCADEPISAQDRRRQRKSYAIEKAVEFRDLPQSVKDDVKRVRKQCRIDWDYYRTHEDDGTMIDNDGDYRLPVFPSPKADSQLKLAKKCGAYTDAQILGAWKKFANRPQGFDGLDFPWSNFFLEFDDYVEVEVGVPS